MSRAPSSFPARRARARSSPIPLGRVGGGEEEVGRGVYGTPPAASEPVPWARIIPETPMCTAARIFSYIYNACCALRAERG